MEGGDSVKIAVVDVARISLAREVQPEASDFSKVVKRNCFMFWMMKYCKILPSYW